MSQVQFKWYHKLPAGIVLMLVRTAGKVHQRLKR